MKPVKTRLVLHPANVGPGDMPSTAETLLWPARKPSPPLACMLAQHTSPGPATSSTGVADVFTFCSFTIFQCLVSLSLLLFRCNLLSTSHK